MADSTEDQRSDNKPELGEDALEPNQVIKPPLAKELVPDLVKKMYGFTVKDIKQLNSYDDLNFHIKVEESHDNPCIDCIDVEGYTFKVMNWLDTEKPGFLESIQDALRHVHSKGVPVPVPIKNAQGKWIERIPLKSEGEEKLYACQLLKFLPGTTLIHIPFTEDALFQYGILLAKLVDAYEDFENPVLSKRNSHWSLYAIPRLSGFVYAIDDEEKKSFVENSIEDFKNKVLPAVAEMDKVIIHGDFNEHNIIVRWSESMGSYEVYGVLDFGDNHLAPLLFEVAVALTYSMIECSTMDQRIAPGHVLAGYLSRRSLSAREIHLLKACIEGRLAQSLTMGAYSFKQDPSNHYVLSTARKGWDLLKKMRETEENDLVNMWRKIINSYQK